MTISQARKLVPGDKVKQKMHGYIMTVNKIEESISVIGSKHHVNIICETDSGDIMKHTHKEVDLIK